MKPVNEVMKSSVAAMATTTPMTCRTAAVTSLPFAAGIQPRRNVSISVRVFRVAQ
jgi:hypothetical protein